MTTYPHFVPDKDIPDLTGKTVVVTGGTAGLGSETILNLVKHNVSKIVFTGRNESAATALIEKVQLAHPEADISFVDTDFTSLRSVHQAGSHIAAANPHIHVVVCNAGVMAIPKAETKDGYEVQFGINHLAHAMLLKLLLPSLLAVAESPNGDARIVSLSSLGAFIASGIDFATLKSEQDMGFLGTWWRYAQSKLANILYAQQLAAHYPSITAVSVHPGVIRETDLKRSLTLAHRWFVTATTFGQGITLEEGVKNQLWAATTAKPNLKNGEFYEPVGTVGRTNKATTNQELAEKLWQWTETQLEAY